MPEESPTHGPDGSTGAPAARHGNGADLRSTTVAYADRADRRTVYPPGLTGVARMERWLTADAGAFRDLEAWR